MKTKAVLSVLAFLVAGLLVNGQNKAETGTEVKTNPNARGVYVDKNNNGVCDSFETTSTYYGRGRMMRNTRQQPSIRRMAQGQGRGMGPGQGRGLGPGQGRGLGPGQGRGLKPGGRYYTDNNKNGVCDLYEESKKK